MRRRLFLAGLVAALTLTACGQTGPGEAGRDSSSGEAPTQVFAAASLHEAFPAAAESSSVTFSFDGSSGLVDQIAGGAPADVFASADRRNMDRAIDAGAINGDPIMFATNYLVLVVPPGNPGGVGGFDASLTGVRLVICAPEVPCGTATAGVLERAGLAVTPVSEETSVTDVLGKVTSGEADAGIVYATDAANAGEQVDTFEIPGAQDAPNTYWIARVTGAPNPEGADAFITMITGAAGQSTLAEFGFGAARSAQ